MRRIVPETQATLRGMMNSNPSPDTSVTYSEGADDEEAILSMRVVAVVTCKKG
jgi:hypothetical protein